MQNIGIKVRANRALYIDTYKTALFVVDDQHNKTTDISNSNEDAEINFRNME